ncbi:MAG: ATP-binding domain-containing protein [Planctomycetota bacterium]|jgi:hypothetical protein|nr:ATP-binding domain-containing protein [Planctomycetota bacterium]
MRPHLITVDGPPGTGKTTTILREAEGWGHDSAVVTYTNDAAGVLAQRAPNVRAGTIYSLTWPYVKPFASKTKRMRSRASAYSTRKIHHLMDPALDQYAADAPSRRAKKLESEQAPVLHGWADGPCPMDLGKLSPKDELTFILPLARWVEAGCPMPEDERLGTIAIDEAQDMGALEIRAALGLLRPDGVAYAYGDPGQAIFAHGKGLKGNSLPAAWTLADELTELSTGYRVGDPVASLAANTLRSYYDRSAELFSAVHTTQIVPWDHSFAPAGAGLVLGYSRWVIAKTFRLWGLTNTAVTPKVSKADDELVVSTGHAAKGSEADDVYILPWSKQGTKRLEQGDPGALRLMYVMLTRARKRLHIPQTLYTRIK